MTAAPAVPQRTTADAISAAARQVAATLGVSAIVSYTTSGATAYRAARERPTVPILVLTAKEETARRLTLAWGTHCVHAPDVATLGEMTQRAVSLAKRAGLAGPGDRVVVTAGVPFGTPGATNILQVSSVG
jgi:pyruvate kinase